jgi:2,4-dienoyl-CoA reductase-like NADH-dependent reductase (Old Yellow Enzyme family)
MAKFERFNFRSLGEIREKAKEVGAKLDFSEDLSPLGREVRVGHLVSHNSFAVLPMEGCDSEPDGSPSELVKRRYTRFAAGGAGLLWYEACAVVHEGRANPLQMFLHESNVKAFASLTEESRQVAAKAAGGTFRPISILQLTHSGRYSRPDEASAPMIPQHDPLLDPRVGVSSEGNLVSDGYLDDLVEKYVKSAILAREAGFDGVDIKSCHRYLVSELLASHTRQGRYGGSFDNRTRFLLEVVKAVRTALGKDFIIACRLNVYDAHPYPYGWGVDKDDFTKADLSEPIELVKLLVENGLDLLSNSAGNPYYRFPQVTRPLDQPTADGELPAEHPLESVARLFGFTRAIQKAAAPIPVIGNGYSWLRQYLPNAGAANLLSGSCSMVGLGREAFAYPDAPRDVLRKGAMDPKKVCIACSKCTQIMRDHGRTGCVIRDSSVYLPLYEEARANAAAWKESRK